MRYGRYFSLALDRGNDVNRQRQRKCVCHNIADNLGIGGAVEWQSFEICLCEYLVWARRSFCGRELSIHRRNVFGW